jgi:transposase-like protein
VIEMSYIPISTDKKKEIIKSYFAGEKIARIANKHGVSRESVYEWSRLADEAITNILDKRGYVNRLEELEKDNQEMKEKLKTMQKMFIESSHISQKYIDSNEFKIQPVICNKCGCTELWKNGGFTRNGYKKLKTENSVQRYTCSNCKANIYVVKKNSE